MNEIIILSTIGFIFGWFTSRVSYKRRLLNFIRTSEFLVESNSELHKKGMLLGNELTKNSFISIIEANDIDKELRHSIKATVSKDSKKNNKD